MSTTTLERQIQQIKPWDQHPDLLAHRAELVRLRAACVEIRDRAKVVQDALTRRLMDHASRTQVADRQELRTVRETAGRDLEAAQLALEQLEGLSPDIERQCREAWVQEHGAELYRAHAEAVRRMADALRAALAANEDIRKVQQLNASALPLPDVGAIGTLPMAAALWFRIAREAGVID